MALDKQMKSYEDYKKLIIKGLESFRYRYHVWDIWQDWLSLMAISISNAVEYHALQERNEEYARIVSKYDKTDFDKFVELFTYLVMALESCNGVYKDLLGEIYHALKLNNENNGEFLPQCTLLILWLTYHL